MGFADVGAGIAGLGSAMSNIANVGINIANYKQAQNALKYQKELQQQIFMREDNAVQRRVADLQAAGLSPVLAAGSAAGSGGVVATNTPQMQNMPDMSTPVQRVMDIITQRQNIAQSAQAIQASQTEQQKKLSDIEINHAALLRYAAEIQNLNARTQGEYLRNRVSAVDADNAEITGVGSNASLPGKLFKDASGATIQGARKTVEAWNWWVRKSNQLQGAVEEQAAKLIHRPKLRESNSKGFRE